MNYSELRGAPKPVRDLACMQILRVILRHHMIGASWVGEADTANIKFALTITPHEAAEANPDDDSSDIQILAISLEEAIFDAAIRLNIPSPFASIAIPVAATGELN